LSSGRIIRETRSIQRVEAVRIVCRIRATHFTDPTVAADDVFA